MILLPRRLFWVAWDLAMGCAVGLLAGMASAGFLWLLERVIHVREQHLWLVVCLPAFAALAAWIYLRWGRETEGGNAMVFDEVLQFRGQVRSRMAPLVLLATLLTHLGGGSAGREGTAVQMGASLARTLGKLPWRWLRLTRSRQRLLLMAGVSAGFGSLFGTPVAGAIFGMEVIVVNELHLEGLVICTVASLAGDLMARFLGVHHPHWAVTALPFTAGLALKVALFALPVAAVAAVFTEGIQLLAKQARQWLANPILRAAMGGLAVAVLALLAGSTQYLNLGTVWLPRVFQGGAGVPPWAFAAKLLFTVVTLAFGLKGGEVTPLLVIGALLGCTLAPLLGLPPAYLAVIGYVCVFAAASNTPLASTLLGAELFGAEFIPALALTGFLAYVLVGHRSIYGMGRLSKAKGFR